MKNINVSFDRPYNLMLSFITSYKAYNNLDEMCIKHHIYNKLNSVLK